MKKQEQILKQLDEMNYLIKEKRSMDILKQREYIVPLMFTMYINAEIRKEQEKYDMATLLLYRLLEMIEQRRLALYGLYVSKTDYAAIRYNTERQPELKGMGQETRFKHLKETVIGIRRELFRGKISTYLSEQISLLDGFILLLALNDEISESKGGNPVDKLRRIRSMVYLRNNSIFAHGLGPVSEGDFKKFRAFVHEIFREFCQIEQIDFDVMADEIRWLNPLDSKNYMRTEAPGQ